MLETILITAAVAFGLGWFARNHVGNIATAAASAVTSATIIHTGTPADAALKSVGAEVAKGVQDLAAKVS